MVCGENIVLAVGHAGCQVGLACWELLCLEHGIYPDGTLATELGHSRSEALPQTRPFFVESFPCKYVPRALFFDFDPVSVSEIKSGCYQSLFCHNQLVGGKEDCCSNFARGFYSMGIEFIECVIDKIRHMAEAADHIDGFIMLRSNCGGTGAGFGSLLINQLDEDYGKAVKLSMEINPSPNNSTSPVEPYNAVLSCHSCMDHINCVLMSENEKMYTIFERYLDVKCATYQNTNQLLAQIFSGITASFRYPGGLISTPSELQANIVPYPRIHFPLLTYSPLVNYEKVYHDLHSVRSLATQAFEPTNQTVLCNPRNGKYIAACLLFRGDVSLNDATAALGKFKYGKSNANRVQFTDWCPTGIKLGLSGSPPIAVPGSHLACGCRSVVGVMNTTSTGEVWRRLLDKFDMMYEKKAFAHWFLAEGVTEDEMEESRMNVESLIEDFYEIGLPSYPPDGTGPPKQSRGSRTSRTSRASSNGSNLYEQK